MRGFNSQLCPISDRGVAPGCGNPPAGNSWAFRLLAWLLCVLLAVPALPAQQSASPDTGAAPTRLKIVVLSETPLTEFAGILSANSLQVRVVDNWDMPVRGATVSFRLPEAGPGGVFLNGLSSEIAITDERGEAAIQGFDWRPETGVTFVHVIAAHGAVRAGAMVEVHLARKLRQWPETVADPPDREPFRQRAPGRPAAPQTSTADKSAPTPSTPPRAEVPVTGSAVLGRQAEEPATEDRRAALLPPVRSAPRESMGDSASAAPVPMVRVKGAKGSASSGAASDANGDNYVRVKQGGRQGGSKVVLWVLVAGAAAGGALAASMAGGGGSGGSGNNPSTSLPPVIRIGNPTITITGGN